MRSSGLMISALACLLGLPALARDGWQDRPMVCDPALFADSARLAHCQAWVRDLKQPDLDVSCCGEADAFIVDRFETDLRDGNTYAIIGKDAEGRSYDPIPGEEYQVARQVLTGSRWLVPKNKINDARVPPGPNPTPYGVIFIILGTGQVVCVLFPVLT